MTMNLREIASRAKVSIATVSRTINRVPTVRPAIARRVQRVIDEVGYYPNIDARALVSGRSRDAATEAAIGLEQVMRELDRTYSSERDSPMRTRGCSL